jgi:elongation factor 3
VAELLLRLALDVAESDDDVAPVDMFEVCDGANDVDAVVGVAGFSFIQSSGLLGALAAEVEGLENAEGREAALLAFKQLCKAVGRACEPYVVPLLPLLLERMADKAAAVREAAAAAAEALVEAMCPRAVELALPSKCGC